MSKPNKFEITFVISGQEVKIEVNSNQPLKSAMRKALSDITDQSEFSRWEARLEDGTQLDLTKKISDLELNETIKVFLSKGAGRGG